MDKKQMKCYVASILAVTVGILLDQYTKLLAIEKLKDHEPFALIKDVFELSYLENRGAAFGIMQNQRLFFILSFILIIVLIVGLYLRLPISRRFLPIRICGILIVSGACGNVIDRLRLGYVVDFFYFKLIDFPVFNVADIFVVAGVIILALLILFYYKEEELDFMFSLKKKHGK